MLNLTAHPTEIRGVIYTTNVIESLNTSLLKLLYLALRNIAKQLTNEETP